MVAYGGDWIGPEASLADTSLASARLAARLAAAAAPPRPARQTVLATAGSR